jgi:MFS family permease
VRGTVQEVFPLAVGRAASFAVPFLWDRKPREGAQAQMPTMRVPAAERTTQPRRTPFYALICADALSMNGNALAAVAIPWFVLATTGSAARTGLTAAASLLPLILAAAFGSVFVDRSGYKRASVIADIASLIAVALIPLLHALGYLSFGLLLALVFLGALLDTPGATARAALRPDLARLGGLRLERSNALHEVVESGAQFSGPLLAGLLIAATSAETALWLNAASFAASATLIGLLVPAPESSTDLRVATPYIDDLATGLRFVLRDPPIRSIFLSALVLNFLISPLIAVLLPYYVKTEHGSPAILGGLIAAFGGGAVVGAVVYGIAGHRLPRRVTFVTGVFSIGLGITTLALLPPVPIMLAAMLLAGLISGPNGPLVATVLQERTPHTMRARVFGASTAIGFSAAPLGVLVAGALLEVTGVQLTLVAMSVIFLAVSCALALDRGLREMDETALLHAEG